MSPLFPCVIQAAILLLASTASAGSLACPPQAGAPRAVTHVVDARTLRLDDGAEVRISGVLPPQASDAGTDSGAWPAEADAVRALERLIGNRPVALAEGPTPRDRYGRSLAHVLLPGRGGAPDLWLERELVATGHARVAPAPGETECLALLLHAESLARASKLGLWSNPAYAVRRAEATRDLLARRGTLQIVEGRVARVAKRGGRVYIDFGPDWRRDTTAVIERRLLKLPGGSERDLSALAHKRIRVRGWIESHFGPAITLATPDAIETLEPADVISSPKGEADAGSSAGEGTPQ